MSDDEALLRAFALLQRAYHFIEDSPRGGHMYGCRANTTLPPSMAEPCNCGRDRLLGEIAVMAFPPPPDFKSTNGHGDEAPL